MNTNNTYLVKLNIFGRIPIFSVAKIKIAHWPEAQRGKVRDMEAIFGAGICLRFFLSLSN